MIVRTNYNSLTSVLALGNLLTSSKDVPENIKVMYICVEDGKLIAVVSDGTVFCKYFLDGEYDLEGEVDPKIIVSVKEMNAALSKYASLSITQVKEIVLQTFKSGIVMTVYEESKIFKDPNAFTDSLLYNNQQTRYKLVAFSGVSRIMDEIPKVILNEDTAIEVEGKEFRQYLDYMYPPMTKPKKGPELIFNNDMVYTIMGNVVGMAMPNNLPKKIFSSINLKTENIKFLQNVISTDSPFKVEKIEENSQTGSSGDWVSIQSILTFKVDNIIIRMKCKYTGDAPGYNCFMQKMPNAVVVDKRYFLDILKRVEGSEVVSLSIRIFETPSDNRTTAEFTIQTTACTLRVPVINAQGSGEFKFSLSPSNLGIMVFSHLTKDADGKTDKLKDLVFCMMSKDTETTHLSCCDRTNNWQTRFPRAPYLKTPQLDF